GAPDRRGARAVGAEPVGRGVGIALLDLDVVGGNADLGGDDLGPRRFVALALALGAHARNAGAGGMHADLAGVEHRNAEDVAVLRRPRPDDFREEGDAEAHDLAGLAALERRALVRLLLAERGVTRRLHHLLHGGVVVAGIVLPAERRVIRELLSPDEILQPQLRRIHAELLREDVHRPFDAVGRLRDAERATVG